MKKKQQTLKLTKEFESSTHRKDKVIDLIKRINEAEKLSSIAVEKQQETDRLQILPGNRTGVVFSLRR